MLMGRSAFGAGRLNYLPVPAVAIRRRHDKGRAMRR